MKNFVLSLSILILSAVAVRAEDVPQFRGPGGLGISKETNLPLTWSATEKIRWKADLPGKGLSNPVIAGGRVYVAASGAYLQKRELVLCFDLKTGKRLWERQVQATGGTQCHPKTNMAAPTPVTDGDRVYALFATGDLVCYDKAGDLVWYRSLVGDYPTVGNNVGMAASPTLHGDTLLIVLENAGESFAAGIDKLTGINRWRIERPRGINWVSPVITDNDGQAEVIFQGTEGLDAHDPVTGKKKWSAPNLKFNTFASLTFADGVIYAAAEKFTAVRPAKGPAEAEVVWQQNKLRPSYCSPVVHKGMVYVVTGAGIVNCANAKTGAIVWSHRLEGPFAASPLLADNRLYVVNEKGVTTVFELGGDQAKVLATNTIDDTFLATPVASDGAIFLRSDTALYCIGDKK
jgi:outer membrane protein assembly factor BamB